MKTKPGILVALLAGIASLPVSGAALGLRLDLRLDLAVAPEAQSFAATTPGLQGVPAAVPAVGNPTVPDTPASRLCADGQRAINQGRWADAVKIFSEVAGQHGDHADGALYWMAYAENKLGQSRPAEATCAELRSDYPKSRWIEDCGALLVEIHAKSGKPMEIEPGQSDDVKLLALSAMLHQDEPRALAEIQAILNGDASEKLKKEAQFILGQHYSNVTFPQIVRISYVEGDVRIQRGAANGKSSGATWEKAVADLPLETGFSLVTGDGRAEIEFENASTLYLGENSVLTFNDLHETAGVPWSDLALLSGTVSMYIHPYVAGEKFILRTPGSDFVAHYPDKDYVRVESYTDAVSVTPLEGADVHLSGLPRDAASPGRTFTWVEGQLVNPAGTPDEGKFSAWDKWVAGRVAERNAATAEVMEESGLTAPIPGLAEMAGKGKFFDCAPYGTCWEPNADADETRQPERSQASPAAAAPAPNSAAQTRSTAPLEVSDRELDFPCTPEAFRDQVVRDPATGKQTVIDRDFMASARYDWAVCHAGGWIRHERHYVWVAGDKRRHIAPVRWIESGHRVGFVPLHPFDVKGQPAINRKFDVFAPESRNNFFLDLVRFDPNRPMEYLKSPPREFRVAPLRPLAPAAPPRMEAHAFPYAPGSKGAEVSQAARPIHFDPQSQSFMMAKQEMRAGRSTTVFAPMSNRFGSLQARGPSYSGNSSARGGNGRSTSNASHSGGSGVSSGSASHVGGGTTTTTSPDAASSSSSAGSSHH